MRVFEGHSRYNLTLLRLYSAIESQNNEDLTNESGSIAPPQQDAVSNPDPSLFAGSFDTIANVLSDRVIRSLKSSGFEHMTHIQYRAIPKIINGADVLIRSATGSGKTLTFLVPALQRLVCPKNGVKITREDGTRVMIICPTRELSIQTQATMATLSRPFPWIVVAAIKGGDSRKSEKAQIRKGITVLVGTPGRVLDHCDSTASFNVSNIELFVLDEADRLLDMGFETKIRAIYKFLCTHSEESGTFDVQTVMTSATLTDAVQQLADFCLRNRRETIGIEDDILALPATLTHEYVLIEPKDKFVALVSLLLKYLSNDEKVLIFVANCQSVVFYHRLLMTLTWPTIGGQNKSNMPTDSKKYQKLLGHNDAIDDYMLTKGNESMSFRSVSDERRRGPLIFDKVPILMLHGSMSGTDRTGYVNDFMSSDRAVMISTDVASRGLNLSKVKRVIQYDPPQQLEEYIHRSGRTARLGGTGHAILLLMRHEAQFINALRKRGVCVKEIMEGVVWSYIEQTYVPKHLRTFKGYNINFLRNCFCDIVAGDHDLLISGQGAFRSSVQSYKTYSRDLRRIFDFKKLHLGHYATSFCLKQKPSEILFDPRHAANESATSQPNKRRLGTTSSKSDKRPRSKDHDRGRLQKKSVEKRPKPQTDRRPKAASLSSAATETVNKALEILKSRNQVLTKR
ncbi:DEAD/DEAH box helicase family protein [Babesia bovis T2Bo]|uniref:ATP-dependent RNA helicase n=1 Tax=Babesia bovis TaxID=5865 RepID=A7ARY5_BABBO|nr:DEAD/DEAH box helicase family protein [Babesia bovis T2Bo]EDO07304.1 DEAD/DEAH box helicase family protein [Babesia bovis T2Bo]|eukprot:XP_001610872.1 DEAD/DEAH box helicase protein family [Babesia bovis T2Bo]